MVDSPTGRIRRTKPDFWPLAYISGPRKLSDALRERPSSAVVDALVNMDYSEIEARVAAWHADMKKLGGDPSTKKEDPDV